MLSGRRAHSESGMFLIPTQLTATTTASEIPLIWRSQCSIFFPVFFLKNLTRKRIRANEASEIDWCIETFPLFSSPFYVKLCSSEVALLENRFNQLSICLLCLAAVVTQRCHSFLHRANSLCLYLAEKEVLLSVCVRTVIHDLFTGQ